MFRVFLSAAILLLACVSATSARDQVEGILALDGSIAPNGRAVELRWLDAKPPRVGSVTVRRRILGQVGAQHWQPVGQTQGPVLRFVDDSTRPGIAYEYQVIRAARDIVDVGYWATGVDLPAVEARGTAHVVVDETVLPDIAVRLARFERDLAGDGWQVARQVAPRGEERASRRTLEMALGIRNGLRERYLADPFGTHVAILVGHVPVVHSGMAAPDGHEPVALPSDLFYADMDGTWGATPEGLLADNRVPGDFIEMQVGRIDFHPVSGGDPAHERHLLNAYFDKNHHWRMGLIGDLRNAYGDSGHLLSERYGLRNIVGPEAVVTGGHHDAGETRPWLWGVDFGVPAGRRYATEFANKAVFTLNFGSGKQRFDRSFNAMTALLAQPWYPLAVGWGARPSWWLHHMALGGTIGEVHLRTVNNGRAESPYRETMDYFPTGKYLWRNPVWVNLLGDPTARAFPLQPASDLVARRTTGGMELSWQASPDPDTTSYRLYRASAQDPAFQPLEGAAEVKGLSFLDPAPPEGARYMVRAHGLKDVYAGSFHTLSQGAFSQPESRPALGEDLDLRTAAGAPVALPATFNGTPEGRIYALVEGPSTGSLAHDGAGWRYLPPLDFTGTVTLRFTVSDAWRTERHTLRITVGG